MYTKKEIMATREKSRQEGFLLDDRKKYALDEFHKSCENFFEKRDIQLKENVYYKSIAKRTVAVIAESQAFERCEKKWGDYSMIKQAWRDHYRL